MVSNDHQKRINRLNHKRNDKDLYYHHDEECYEKFLIMVSNDYQ